MIKTKNWMLMALLTVGLSMGSIACSDDDDSSDGAPTNETEYKESQLGWDIITQLTAERTAPEGWQNMTFEPTIGRASEADPYTRIVSTNDVAAAAERFGGLVGFPDLISETTSSYTYTHEGMGKLTYQMGSVGGQYLAQVDVDLKQVPHLKKILYQTPDQMGNNGRFDGTAYYRFGDVVLDTTGYYWICVRPAFGPEGKEDSHWMCLSQTLPEANIKPYKTSTGIQNYLPTGLGKSTEHMQNAAEVFYAMTHPEDWHHALTSSPKLKMFNDFSINNYKYHNIYFWQLVCKAWEKRDLFKKVLGISKAALANDEADWHMLYSGYSWWFSTSWECNLYEVTFKKGSGKKANRHDVTYSKPTKDMHQIVLDAKNGSKVGCVSGDFFDDDSKIRWYARYKKGSELGGGRYDVKRPISGCTDIYTYNNYYGRDVNFPPEETTKQMVEEEDGIYTGSPYYLLGDVLVDEDGARWFCVQHSGLAQIIQDAFRTYGKDGCLREFGYRAIASKYAWFISLTPYDKNRHMLFEGSTEYYNNLPTLDQAKYISHFLNAFMICGIWTLGGESSDFGIAYKHIKEYAKVDLEKVVVRRDSLFDSGKNIINHTVNSFANIAYSDKQLASQRMQGYLRSIFDNCALDVDRYGNPKPGSRDGQPRQQTCYTTGNYSKLMTLQDLTDANHVSQYAYDPWVTLAWYSGGNEGDPGGPGKYTKYPPEPIRDEGYAVATPNLFFWDEDKIDFVNPSMTSMYKEPIIICRVMKVKDCGEKATKTSNGKNVVEEYLCEYNGSRNDGSSGTLNNLSTQLSKTPYFFNGKKSTVLDIPLLGEEPGK